MKTDPLYWDCECEKDYIHHKHIKTCKRCGAMVDQQPDSRVNEVEKVINVKSEILKIVKRNGGAI